MADVPQYNRYMNNFRNGLAGAIGGMWEDFELCFVFGRHWSDRRVDL